MYDRTQEELVATGNKTVTLYRGVNVDDPQKYASGDKINITANALESWSTDSRVAGTFGNVIMKAEVPIEKIVSTARTGFGCLNEWEFVASGVDESTIWGFG